MAVRCILIACEGIDLVHDTIVSLELLNTDGMVASQFQMLHKTKINLI